MPRSRRFEGAHDKESSCALERPQASGPNTSAQVVLSDSVTRREAACSLSSKGHARERRRAVAPITQPQSATAPSRLGKICTRSRISSAPAARAVAAGSGNIRGLTRRSSESPMFAMTLAAAPMFPGWVVSTMMIRKLIICAPCCLIMVCQPRLAGIGLQSAPRRSTLGSPLCKRRLRSGLQDSVTGRPYLLTRATVVSENPEPLFSPCTPCCTLPCDLSAKADASF